MGVFVVLFAELGHPLIFNGVHPEGGGIVRLEFGINPEAVQTVIMAVLDDQTSAGEIFITPDYAVAFQDGSDQTL